MMPLGGSGPAAFGLPVTRNRSGAVSVDRSRVAVFRGGMSGVGAAELKPFGCFESNGLVSTFSLRAGPVTGSGANLSEVFLLRSNNIYAHAAGRDRCGYP